jgi:peptidyl-tRNA hydrolase
MKLYAIVSNQAVAASGGNRGKIGAQLGHAYVHSVIDAMKRFPHSVTAYLGTGVVGKVCLAADEEVLRELVELYQPRCGVFLVTDAAKTVFKVPMITALGIGPINPDDREDILANLRPWI